MPKRKSTQPAEGLSIAIKNGEVTPTMEATRSRPRRMGRPRITLEALSQRRRDEILKLARLGMSYKMIAGAIGMSAGKLIELRDENPEFQKAIERERENFVSDNLQKLRQHANTSPQSAMWLLERIRPEDFSSKAELRVSGGTTSTLTVDIGKGLCERLSEARAQPIPCTLLSSEKISGDLPADDELLAKASPD